MRSSSSLARVAVAALLSVSLAFSALARGANGGAASSGAAAGASGSSGPTRGGDGTVTAIGDLSRGAGQAIDACDLEKTPTICVADVLDKYAVELAEIAPQLPAPLRNLPEIIATSARKVRAAKTKTEALHAIGEAIVAVHKSIALLKADDPVAHQVATREGGFVVETLQIANAKLEKAVGL